jgi:hypothetical protein
MASPMSSPRARWAAAVVLVWLAACVPLLVADVLPLVDYPAHLARVQLLADPPAGTDAFYRPAWTILPNLALEFVCVPLAHLVPAPVALRIFVALTLGLFVWGGALLSRAATGRVSPLAFLPALLVYNHVLAFGFVNFLFGLGLAMVALARHIEGGEDPLGRRLLRESAFALALFASHIIALGVYLLAAALHDLASRSPRLRRDAAVLAGAAVAPILLLLLSPTRREIALLGLHPLSAKLDKLFAVPQTGQGAWDAVFAIAALAYLATILVFRLARMNRPLALVALGLAAAFLLAPYRFATAENVDTRLPVVFIAIALAAFELTASGRRARAVAVAFAALFAFRIATTTVHYHRSARVFAAVRADLAAAVPAGSLLFTAREVSAPTWYPTDWNPPLFHAPALLLLDRPVYLQMLFAHPTQQPLARTAPFADLDPVDLVGVVWQPHLEAYGENLLQILDAARRPEPAYLFFLKGPGRLFEGPTFDVVVDRPRYAILRLRE